MKLKSGIIPFNCIALDNIMKPAKNADDLAARLAPPSKEELVTALTEAANTPPQRFPKATRKPKGRPTRETVGITLRLPKTLLTRYTMDAAELTKQKGRVVSAQEVMLEQLAAKS